MTNTQKIKLAKRIKKLEDTTKKLIKKFNNFTFEEKLDKGRKLRKIIIKNKAIILKYKISNKES